jgi:hypothetical protein
MQIMEEGIGPGLPDVGIGGQVKAGVKNRRGVSAFLPALVEEMSQGVDPRLFDVWIVEQVVGAVKQSTGIHSPIFLPSSKEFLHWVLRLIYALKLRSFS